MREQSGTTWLSIIVMDKVKCLCACCFVLFFYVQCLTQGTVHSTESQRIMLMGWFVLGVPQWKRPVAYIEGRPDCNLFAIRIFLSCLVFLQKRKQQPHCWKQATGRKLNSINKEDWRRLRKTTKRKQGTGPSDFGLTTSVRNLLNLTYSFKRT